MWTKRDKNLLVGACSDGKEWALTLDGPLAVLTCKEPPDKSWPLWLAGRCGSRPDLLTAKARAKLDACAEAKAGAALIYCASLLTAKRLDSCAEAESCLALKYCASLLTAARLDACAEARPWAALEYCAKLLTAARRARCKKYI